MQGIIYGCCETQMILFAKLCYGLPHCGCKLCYRPPLKRLSEVNFISFPDIENEDSETAHEIDNISYKEKEIRFKSYWLACQRNVKLDSALQAAVPMWHQLWYLWACMLMTQQHFGLLIKQHIM